MIPIGARGRMAGMKYRKLRIAWSVGWGILCLSLIALCVRSFTWIDVATGPVSSTSRASMGSYKGWLTLSWNQPLDGFVQLSVQHNSIAIIEKFYTDAEARGETVSRPVTSLEFRNGSIKLPHWFPAVLLLTIAAIPWFRWRFSLRTLLIGMTVAAIGLGWFVFAIRK